MRRTTGAAARCTALFSAFLPAAVALPGDWVSGTATYYGDSVTGGHCDIGNYGAGTWINGLYVATASNIWCGASSNCGNTHSPDCGRCYEVECLGTDTNTDAFGAPCHAGTVTVVTVDECPGGSHCSGTNQHFDLSTKAFEVIGKTAAGVLNIRFRRVDCSPPAGTNLKLIVKGSRWHLKVGAWDVAGPGSLSKIEVQTPSLGTWTDVPEGVSGYYQRTTDMGTGPTQFRLTADDGQQLEYTLEQYALETTIDTQFDVGANFATSSGLSPGTTSGSTSGGGGGGGGGGGDDGTSPGVIAAAVLVPLLVVGGGVGAFFYWRHVAGVGATHEAAEQSPAALKEGAAAGGATGGASAGPFEGQEVEAVEADAGKAGAGPGADAEKAAQKVV